jgi:hypothetical protein
LREVKERRRRGELHGLAGESWWNDRGERRRGGKDDSFYCSPTGWRRASPVRPVTAPGRAREPLSVFPTQPR